MTLKLRLTYERLVWTIVKVFWPPYARVMRWRAKKRYLAPGQTTVVTVNWNAREQVEVLVRAVRQFSPPGTEIIVIDNASSDRSKEFLDGLRDVKTVLLPVNIRHARALDLGFMLSETEYTVALDVDAFPVSHRWLTIAQEYLSSGKTVVGARYHDRLLEYAHPCFLVVKTEHFLKRRLSFIEVRESGDMVIDTGAAISMREANTVEMLDPSECRGPGIIGTTFASIVYHNFFGTRLQFTKDPAMAELAAEADAAWTEAVRRYLGPMQENGT